MKLWPWGTMTVVVAGTDMFAAGADVVRRVLVICLAHCKPNTYPEECLTRKVRNFHCNSNCNSNTGTTYCHRSSPSKKLCIGRRVGRRAQTIIRLDNKPVVSQSCIFNSHPVKAPHMAPLVMHYELSFDRSWGWSSGIVGVPSVARRGFETACNDFFIFALASIAEIPL